MKLPAAQILPEPSDQDLAANDLIDRFRDMQLLISAHGKDGLYLETETLSRAKRLANFYAESATIILLDQMLSNFKTPGAGQA